MVAEKTLGASNNGRPDAATADGATWSEAVHQIHLRLLQDMDAAALERGLARLLSDKAACHALGERARRFVLGQQGATAKTLDALDELCEGLTHQAPRTTRRVGCA